MKKETAYNTNSDNTGYGHVPWMGAVSSMVGGHGESLLRIIWHRRLIVLLVSITAIGIAFIYLFQARPIYISGSRLYVEQKGPKIITEDEGFMMRSYNYVYTQCELLKSTPILAAAVATDTALEINASWRRLDLKDLHIRQALDAGAILSINTDSHHTDQLDQMSFGIMTARRGWTPPDRVINTWTLSKLRKWLQSR